MCALRTAPSSLRPQPSLTLAMSEPLPRSSSSVRLLKMADSCWTCGATRNGLDVSTCLLRQTVRFCLRVSHLIFKSPFTYSHRYTNPLQKKIMPKWCHYKKCRYSHRLCSAAMIADHVAHSRSNGDRTRHHDCAVF